jgi:hypothetical protein
MRSLSVEVARGFDDSREQVAALEKILCGRLAPEYLLWNGRTRQATTEEAHPSKPPFFPSHRFNPPFLGHSPCGRGRWLRLWGLWLRAGWARRGAGDLPSLPLARREPVEGLSRKGENMDREGSGTSPIPAFGDGVGVLEGAAPGPRRRETASGRIRDYRAAKTRGGGWR